jgi:hypothetical protein
MPVIYEKETVMRRSGIVCDCCGAEDTDGFNDFAVEHTLGYGSPLDGTVLTAAICDDCLVRLVLEHVPGAVFRDNGPGWPALGRSAVALAIGARKGSGEPRL